MNKCVQIKKRYPLGEGFTYLDETFSFRYQETESEISSEDTVEESTYWTKEEILELLAQPSTHPAFTLFMSIEEKSEKHDNTPRSLSPELREESNEVDKPVLNSNSFFMSRKQVMGASIILLDSALLLGLAVAGLLSMQHLAFIMLALAATSTIAAVGSYHYSPQLG